MTACELLQHEIDLNLWVIEKYLTDLSDADLLIRPVAEANCIAYQLGHIIVSAHQMLAPITQVQLPQLPSGFAARHAKDQSQSESSFCSKDEYLKELKATYSAIRDGLSRIEPAYLSTSVPGLPPYISTVGQAFFMSIGHLLMHAGQFAVVRRKLGKPIVI